MASTIDAFREAVEYVCIHKEGAGAPSLQKKKSFWGIKLPW